MEQVIGVDIGGTKIKAGLVSNNKAAKKIVINTQANKGKKAVIKNFLLSIEKLFNKDIIAVCVGCPGPINPETGVIERTPNLPLKGVNLKKIIRQKFRKPVFIDNDANCFALAEAVLGRGKKYSNVVGLTIGTGFGSGIIISKKIYHGKCFTAEIGHTTINFNGPKARCGNNGCLESYVSVRGILSRASGLYAHDQKELFELAEKGSKKAIKIWEETGFYLGIGCANIINTLNPDIIIIGGKISGAWRFFNNKMKETAKKRALFSCKIVKSS